VEVWGTGGGIRAILCLYPAGKLRHEVAADQGMKPKEKRVVENGVFELAVFDSLLECQDVARQMRRELGVA